MKIVVARTLNDFMKVMIIRGIVFIGEHGHKYNMEFDEHELCNRTNLIAQDDEKEPAGIMRIQKDGKEAKFERLAVMPEYRGRGVAENIVKAGIKHCRAQGVENVCLFCEPELEQYWTEQNFERVGGNKVFKYRGLDLIPVMKKINPENTPLTAEEKSRIPNILLQQKGTWVENNGNDQMAVIIKKTKGKQK